MILRSVRHKGLRLFIESNQAKGLRADMVNRIRNIITALVVVEDMEEFRQNAPPGWRVHQLTGDRKEVWSVSVSGNWRITFIEDQGQLYLLDLEDYH